MRFFHKIRRIEYNKLIFIFEIDNLCRVCKLKENPGIFLYVLVVTVSFLSMQVKNSTEPTVWKYWTYPTGPSLIGMKNYEKFILHNSRH